MLPKAPEVDLKIPEIPVDLGKPETPTRAVHAVRQTEMLERQNPFSENLILGSFFLVGLREMPNLPTV